ncbi:helix-turn-helix transcriptional regulator [Nocardia sp. NPDC057668]|uniref:helix-turn-helix transcriptional regulator n=1 Tax=Nocardia sp. NPDC057668 TaxID=3346202 RepID=UPI0036732EFD
MDSAEHIGGFLASRRARLRPEDVGLPFFGTRRRVPGLRREELAQVAGVSVDYYARLEQGRLENVSPAILDAVASALRLSADERTHLYNLARPPHTPGDTDDAPALRPALHALLAAMEQIPAYIVGHHTNILGWNRAAELFFGVDFAGVPPAHRSWAHLVFLDPQIHALLAEQQPGLARQIASDLRLRAGHRPGDPEFTEFIARMRSNSRQFDELWSSHDVTDVAFGSYSFRHPVLGPIELNYEFLPLIGDPGARALVTYTAVPGTPAHRALRDFLSADNPDSPSADQVEQPG